MKTATKRIKADARRKDSRPRKINRGALMRTLGAVAEVPGPQVHYRAPDLPPGVVPSTLDTEATGLKLAIDEKPRMALDNGGTSAPLYGWLNQFNAFGGGLFFPGYPILAELTQISEYRAPSETVSMEMCRKWVEIISKGKGDKTAKIKDIHARMEELNVRGLFQRAALHDGEFGMGNIVLNIKGQNEDGAQQLPLQVTPQGIKRGSLESIQTIEPYWITPYSWNANRADLPDFYKPHSWYILGRKTHSSRMLTMIGREVPDLLKPAYNFGGISLTQLMKPYVDMWLRTRKSVNDIVNNFSITMLATNLQATLEEGNDGMSLLERLKLFTLNRNNQGVGAINKGTEEIVQINTPLGSLDKLQAQSQEHMAAPAHIPLIKLFGVVPTGLNATGEGEIQVWYDFVHAYQENLFGAHLCKLLRIIQLDLFGVIDEDIVHQFVPLDQPTAKETSDMQKTAADAGVAYINAGVVAPEEERERLQTDPHSGYNNLNGPPPEPPEPDAPPGAEADGADVPEGTAAAKE